MNDFLADVKARSQNPLWLVLALSGLLGFFIGMFGHATWHHAVEGAQAISGTAHYPQPTPFFIYQAKAWTLFHQIPALFFKMGFTEIQLSSFFSGLTASLSFMALAMCAYAFTGEVLFAIGMPFFMAYTKVLAYGPTYPIILMGVTTSYGTLGQGWMLLTLGLLTLHRFRLSGFMLGLAPAMHVGLAAPTYAIVLLIILFLDRDLWTNIKKSFLMGLFFTFISLGAHLFYVSTLHLPELPIISKTLLCDYMRNWDSHRMPVSWEDPGLWVNVLMMGMSFLSLSRYRDKMPKTSTLLLQTAFTAGLLGILATALSWMPLEWIPLPILKLMPGRVLNFNILLFPIFIIGILRNRKGLLSQLITLFALIYFPFMVKFESDYTEPVLFFIAMSTFIFLIIGWDAKDSHHPVKRFLAEGISLSYRFVFCALIFIFARTAWITYPDVKENFIDWSKDALLEKVKNGQGVLLLGPDLSAIQMVTRRPILVDGGALDIISYFPELAKPIADIMSEIYGISLFNPPADIEHVAIMPVDLSQPIWENRSEAEWKMLKEKFGFSEILTSGWTLKLPLIAQDESFKLYRVP